MNSHNDCKVLFFRKEIGTSMCFYFLVCMFYNKFITFILVKKIFIIQYSCHKINQAFSLKFFPAATCIKPPFYLSEPLESFLKTSNASLTRALTQTFSHSKITSFPLLLQTPTKTLLVFHIDTASCKMFFIFLTGY